jgi:site-specific recombinase XerD
MSEIIVSNVTTDLGQQWADAVHLWLDALGADTTRRAYREAWQDLLTFIGDVPPWRVGRSDLARWVADMRSRKLSPCTRNQKVAAISSLYIYAMSEYTITSADDREVPLHYFNPASGKSLRAHINPYGKVRPMTVDEVKQLLAVIDRSTLQGLRDYALFLCYLFTARRNSEIRKLTWENIERAGSQVFYKWSGKGKTNQRHEMAMPAYQAICEYLQARGVLETIEQHDFIFTGLVDNANRLPVVETYDPDKPLSMRMIGKLLKTYLKKARLDHKTIHVHTLRHTAAYLRRLAGDDLESISRLLSHSSLAITQIYLTSVEGHTDTSWQKVGELIGVKT